MNSGAGRPRRVLIVKPGSLGDVVHALPVAAALRRAWPDARIAWVVDTRWRELLDGNPVVDEVVPFPRARFRGILGLPRGAAWARSLARLEPDLCLDLQGLLRSALMARAARPRLTIGLGDAREGASFLHNAHALLSPGMHGVRRCLAALECLGIPADEPPRFPLPRGIVPPGLPEAPFVVIHGRSRGIGKSLPPEVTRAIARGLGRVPAVAVGAGMPDPGFPGIDLGGRTSLLELLGVLRAAAFVVSVDSGPAHLAAALGTPLLAIHSWSDPRAVGPFHEQAWIWQRGTIRRQDLAAPRFTPGPLPGVEDAARIAGHVLEHLAAARDPDPG